MKTTATTASKEKSLFNKENNGVLLKRKNTIFVQPDSFHYPNHITALNLNIASLGYTLSPELFKVLQTKSTEDIAGINLFLVKTLSEMVGANVKYTPLFRNFPKDVPDDFTYLLDRIVGYIQGELGITENAKLLSCGHLIDTETFDMSNFGACPICQNQISDIDLLPAKERKPLKGKIKLKTIGLGKENDVQLVFKNLVSSTTSISQTDKEDISTIFLNSGDKIQNFFPDVIPHKEVLAYVSKLVIEHLPVFELIENSIKTATDVLRIATSLSDGDVSLAKNTKYKKFTKSERKFLLYLLEKCKSGIEEDMLRYKTNWIRLGEILHPSEYTKRFPKTAEAFYKLRNDVKIDTFNSKSEALIASNDFGSLIKHLSVRPSELARKLDLIISKNPTWTKFAIDEMVKGAESIATPVLLQVMANFRIRATEDKSIRMIMPKGNVAKMQVLEETREPIKASISKKIISLIKKELKRRFSELEPMGKVFIDENLVNYVVPFSQRSASKALVTITRGSKVDLPKEKTIRMFTYWKENGQRVDLDLSAVMFDENFKYKEHISYTNYHGRGGYVATHSGDITSAPRGASEFIDIDVESFIKYKCRYVVMNLLSYTQQPFSEFADCFAGIMGREKAKSGEIYEPKTVKQKFDLTSDARISVPLILDLVEGKMIWCDLALRPSNRGSYNVEYNSDGIIKMLQAMVEMGNHKTNIHELLTIHAKARGKVTKDRDKADIIFDETNIPFENDTIVGKYLV
ncbi:MAG: cytoplasmic protein [Micavibrio sp.]|nr:cytoplasmic protein [Micavibrio sp.]